MGIHTTPELWVRKMCAVCALNDSQKWRPFKFLNKRPNVVFNPIHNIIIYYTHDVTDWPWHSLPPTSLYPCWHSQWYVPILLIQRPPWQLDGFLHSLISDGKETKTVPECEACDGKLELCSFLELVKASLNFFLCALNKSRWLKDCISLSALSECMVSCLHSGCPLVCAGTLGSIGIWRSRQYWCSGR